MDLPILWIGDNVMELHRKRDAAFTLQSILRIFQGLWRKQLGELTGRIVDIRVINSRAGGGWLLLLLAWVFIVVPALHIESELSLLSRLPSSPKVPRLRMEREA